MQSFVEQQIRLAGQILPGVKVPGIWLKGTASSKLCR